MAYASPSDLRRHLDASQVAARLTGTVASQDVQLVEALGAASQMIDSALVAAGHEAPLFGIGTASQKTAAEAGLGTEPYSELIAFLKLKAITLATAHFLVPADETKRHREARADCKAWLDELKAGRGLPVQVPAPSTYEGIDWIPLDDATVFSAKRLSNARRADL